MTKTKGNIKEQILTRVRWFFLFSVLIGITVFLRIIYLNVFRSEELLEKSKKFSELNVIIPANRGDILSENGKLLATSLPKYEIRLDLVVVPKDTLSKYINHLAKNLSDYFQDKTAAEYKENIVSAHKNRNRYYLLKRDLTFPQLKVLEQFPIFNKGKYKGGFIVIERTHREKPFGELASRTLGYTAFIEKQDQQAKTNPKRKEKKTGRVGLERTYEDNLQGTDGFSVLRRLSFRRVMPVEEEIEPIDGADIVTTLNVPFQDIVESELRKGLQKHDADFGTAVLMEVASGKIKAIANLKKIEEGNYREKYNYAIGELLEPGSTFKLMSLMVALEDGVIQLKDSVDVEKGKKKYYDRTMEDSHLGDNWMTVQQAFEKSSNVGVSKLIVENYKQQARSFIERLYSMHLDKKTGVKIKGEGVPFIKYPDDDSWSGVSLPWMSIGYELLMTPLQVLTFYNAVANNGVMMKPFLVSKIQKGGDVLERFEPQVLNPSICSKKTIKKAQKLLRGVVENGTATNINNKKLSISGKTGTAQIANKNIGYKSGRIAYNCSFVGYFPSENPQYSCIVLVSHPRRGGYYASTTAAPIFRKIADKVYASSLSLLKTVNDKEQNNQQKIPHKISGKKEDVFCILKYLNTDIQNKTETSTWVNVSEQQDQLEAKDRFINQGNMPDVRGLGLKDALFILENRGLNVKIYGKGKVRKQSLPVGSRIKKNQRVVLELK